MEGTSELVLHGGTNSNLLNALHEGGPKNGVLTAIEDFINDRQDAWLFELKPEFYGLGILRRATNRDS
jgi:hypothetical protein